MWLWFPSKLGLLSKNTDTDVKLCMTCYVTLPILGVLLSLFGWGWGLGLWLAGACTLACNAYWLVLVAWIYEFRLAYKLMSMIVTFPPQILEGGAQTVIQTLHLDVQARGTAVARGGGSVTATGAPCGFRQYMWYVHHAIHTAYRYSTPIWHYKLSLDWTQVLLVVMHSKKRYQVYRLLWLPVYACLNYKHLYAYGIQVRGGRYADMYSRQTMVDLALLCKEGLA